MSMPIPSLTMLKGQAKSLRGGLAGAGVSVSHSQSLELLAKQHGFRDWNTLHAAAGNRVAEPYQIGQSITGRYLGQPFRGEIIQVRRMSGDERFGVTIKLDEPLDVLPQSRISNIRYRVSGRVDRRGMTVERTSDGQPHLVLDLDAAS